MQREEKKTRKVKKVSREKSRDPAHVPATLLAPGPKPVLPPPTFPSLRGRGGRPPSLCHNYLALFELDLTMAEALIPLTPLFPNTH
jgi:hypothetical protein